VGFSSRSHRTRCRRRHLLPVPVVKIKPKGRICLYVPEIRTGSTSPLRFFLKNGSIIFSKIAFAPRVVFDIFVSTCSWPCRSILWLIPRAQFIHALLRVQLGKLPAPTPNPPRSFTFSKKGRSPGGISVLACNVTVPDIGARFAFTNKPKMSSIRPFLTLRSISAVLLCPPGDSLMLPSATTCVRPKCASRVSGKCRRGSRQHMR
jgi:hypothetical protein